MAKTHKSKPKSSLFLCCFGSFPHEASTESGHSRAEPGTRWFSWRRIPKRKSATKTVPHDASFSDHKCRVDKVHSSKWKWKSKLKSKSNPRKPSLVESQTPVANPAPPCQTPPMVPVTPNHTPPQTRLKQRERQNLASNGQEIRHRSRRLASLEDDTRRQSSSSPAMSHSVSIPASKRQARCLSSTVSTQPQRTMNQPTRLENAKGYDPVFGMSLVLVTLVIMTLCGRLCAIFCTAMWLYLIPRFRTNSENDIKNTNTHSNDVDLDSEVYKKKVILEGLLERNHRGTF